MQTTYFAPLLYIPHGTYNIDFYENGLGAVELRQFLNDDGSYHVSELAIDGAMFHLHEENISKRQLEPIGAKGTTAIIGLFVPDVDAAMNRAVAAGATIITPAQDYDYGYRQGELRDPFGHLWAMQKKI